MPTTLAPAHNGSSDTYTANTHGNPNWNIYFMPAREYSSSTSKTPIFAEHVPWLFDTGTSLFAAKINLPASNDFSFARKLLDHAARILPSDDNADLLVDHMLGESIRGRKSTKRSRV